MPLICWEVIMWESFVQFCAFVVIGWLAVWLLARRFL